MQPLRFLLSALIDRPEVAGAAVVSEEGLVIEASLPAAVDRDAIAALAATALRHLTVLSESLAQGALHQLLLENADGVTAVVRLPSHALLIVLAAPDADLGQLFYELRRHLPALTPLV